MSKARIEKIYHWAMGLGLAATAVALIMIMSGCSTLGNGKLDLDQLNNLDLTDLANLDPSKLPIKELATLLGAAYGINVDAAETLLTPPEGVDTGKAAKTATGSTTGRDRPFQPIPLWPVYIPGDCRKGNAVIKVSNIPIMTDANKDDLNKTLLFAIQSEDGSNMLAVFHRYLQPDWPHGEWWPTWRIEAGACNCVEEWHVFDSDPLPGTQATFEIVWNGNKVSVRHSGTGDTQTLTTSNVNAFEGLTGDVVCYNEKHGNMTVERLTWNCKQAGAPGGCRR